MGCPAGSEGWGRPALLSPVTSAALVDRSSALSHPVGGRPFHTLPYEELLTKLRAQTNLRVVPDPTAVTGYTVEPGPFPGWASPLEW